MKIRLAAAPYLPLFVAALLLGLLLGGLAAAQGPGEPTVAEAASGEVIAPEDLGLSKTSVFATPSPPPVVENTAEPGEAPLLPRAYPGAPPRIPHTIADFLPVTRRDNLCIDCHLIEEEIAGGPTPIPASHKTDLRRSPGNAGDSVVGARWVCVSCHVAKTEAQDLVVNRFGEGNEPEGEECEDDGDCDDCSTNADCEKDEFCSKPAGECEGRGRCTPRPEVCIQIFDPVCGCDHQVYPNSCEAAASGASVLSSGGECPQR